VKGILASGRVQAEPDLEGLWHYVSLRFLPGDYSLFKGIKKLPAATTLTWKAGRIWKTRYWEPSFLEKTHSSERELTDQLDAILQETVSSHVLSDVPVGAFLSGGIDSSTVASIMAKQSQSPVPVFSIGVEEQGFNELPYARMVAQRYGMQAYEEIVKADLVHLIPEMVHHMEEPSDPFGMGVFFVSRLASKHVKVVLTGDGGDENFAGYDRYVGQSLVDWYCLLPEWLRRSVMRRLIKLIPESFAYKSLALKAQWVNEMSFYTRGNRYAHSLSFLRFVTDAKEQLFTSNARSQIADDDSTGKILQYFDAANVEDLVDRMLFTDLMTRMPDHLLALGDRMSMAHSLECRPTLVDHKLVEFAATLPTNLKLKGMQMKYLLKKVAGRHLPQELIRRKKQGFTFPLGHWMREDLRGFIQKLFAQSRFVQHGLFDQSYIDKLFAEHVSGAADHNYRLWILINLEFWYRLYIENESLDSMREFTDELLVT
jgi:asparagine synthase (glutamine-hydrolysing)